MRYHPPRLAPVGDSGLLIEFGDEIDLEINAQVHALAQVLQKHRPQGVKEAVPTYRSLLVHYDPLLLSWAEAVAQTTHTLSRMPARIQSEPRIVDIPTCYGGEFGPDLDSLAHGHGLRPEDVCRLHTTPLYPVYMLGFSPGFAYLGGVPQAIATPRLATPRILVPAGSVAIAGEQTGIYPFATPGGWQIVGRTPLRLFDPQRDPPALLRPGDRVRFVAISPDEFAALWQREWDRSAPPSVRNGVEPVGLRVLRPGLHTTVQDLGRWGYQSLGVPVAGAMDPFALQAANHLVGNNSTAASLEMTVRGPTLEADVDCLIAVTGADLGLQVNGQPIPGWSSVHVQQGWRIEFTGRRTGCRAYLAVAGGVSIPPVLGSRATYLRAGLGGLEGRPLRAGDIVPIGPVDRLLSTMASRRFPANLIPCYSERPAVAVILGPQLEAFTSEGVAAFLSSEYQIGPMSDRMGYRLQGPAISHCGPADILSDGLVVGAVQVPADQQPIVMMADHQTTGGYPKIGVVARADVPLLAQCLPGAPLRFVESSVGEAQDRFRQRMAVFQEQDL